MTETTPVWKLWVEAGKTLAADPHAKVKCPVHGDAYLEVHDTPVSDGRWERILRCPGCGAYNAILFSREP